MGSISATLASRAAVLAIALSLLPGLAAPPAALAVVGPTLSTTTLSVPTLNPKPVGETSTLTATVNAGATGDVTFYDNGVEITTVALDGSNQAAYTVPGDATLGAHTIKAEYQGDGTYAKSEASRPITVGPRPVTVGLGFTGPHDASGATAHRGDTVTASVSVIDHGTTGSLAVSGGSVQVKVDGVLKATITLPASTADLDTSDWAPGVRSVVATYDPGAATDHAAGSSTAFKINVLMASASVQYTTFYPYKDSYRDGVALRGSRFQPESVAIKVISPAGKTVKTFAVATAGGAWSVTWNGRNSAGTMLAAGKYKVLSTVTAGTAKQTFTTYVTLSAKRLYTYSATYTKDFNHTSKKTSTWVAWNFTLPSATVYKSISFWTYGKDSHATGGFGPHDYTACSSGTMDPNCATRWRAFPTSYAWKSVTGSVSKDRAGRYVRLYAWGGYNTYLKYGRVKVTYAVLK